MRRILFINSVCGKGSTGRICTDLYEMASEAGFECCIAYGRDSAPEKYRSIRIGNEKDFYLHALLTRLFDRHGFGSKKATEKFLKQVEKFQPDIIHLHNIHGYYLNIKSLFEYFEEHRTIRIIWTLHDCWPFTGHCAYFTFSNCGKWKESCEKCRFRSGYPKNILFSDSKRNFLNKKELFTSVSDMTLVTPSKWLKEIAGQSFMKNHRCLVINNGIDSSIFKKTDVKKHKKITTILGVANVWDERKGLPFFLELAEKLKEKDYEIVLVGLSKKQLRNLPPNIRGIGRTSNIGELVELYNSADVFFNPTLEDNYPTVNLEAQACGLAVVTFDSGGAKETIFGDHCYYVNTLEEFLELLDSVDFKNVKCSIDRQKYDKYVLFDQYIKLYEDVLGGI